MTIKFLIIAIVVFVIVLVFAGLLVSLPEPVSDKPLLSDRVVVTSPQSGATVEKTFTVSGSAPGQWFFEAVFPVQVRNADNILIANAHAQAQGEWMTEGLVPFNSIVSVKDFSGPAILTLLRDNPSGLPENDDSVSLPIIVQ